MSERKLIQMNMPADLLKEIEQYQDKNYIVNRTAAIIELIRKGLNK